MSVAGASWQNRKVCSSCGTHYGSEEWQALAIRGRQPVVSDWTACNCGAVARYGSVALSADGAHTIACAGRGFVLEMRNCVSCGSTLAVKVDG